MHTADLDCRYVRMRQALPTALGVLAVSAALTAQAATGVVTGATTAMARITNASTTGTLQPSAASVPTSRYLPGTQCPVFPADNIWHADITKLPVSKYSTVWLSHLAPATSHLHPDFGPSFGAQPVPYGIAYTVVRNTHATFPVAFGYASESDRVRYPLGADTKIEGGTNAAGDRHAIIVNADTCRLYETWDTHHYSTGWYAGSGATWNLKSDALRPAGWTSADAAGLPILPGLLRYDEILAGSIDHAIRFTVNTTNRAYVWPARHQAGSVTNAAYLPMGARLRLKASFSLAGWSPKARIVLAAMKKYGLIVADNGSNWYFQGTSDTRWPIALIDELKRIPASAFQAVDESSLRISANSGVAR